MTTVDEFIDALKSAKATLEMSAEIIKELADDLEAHIESRYPPSIKAYPVMQEKYERDMELVHRARKFLGEEPPDVQTC